MSRIPIFPLELVLFPGMPLPLHIFEERYKEMVGEALQNKTEFGLIQAKDDGLAPQGCTATIVEVLNRHPDGRLDIMTEGQRRFRLMKVIEERSFLEAEVEWLPEQDSALQGPDRDRALRWCGELLRLTNQADDAVDADVPLLSYHIAGPLPFGLEFRQSLLEMRREAERIRAVADALESLVPKLQRALKARKIVGGNGNAVH